MSRCSSHDPAAHRTLADSPSTRCVRGKGHRGLHRDPFGEEFSTADAEIRCDYCGDALPSVAHRSHVPTTPDLQRLGFSADKIVCPECATKARATKEPR